MRTRGKSNGKNRGSVDQILHDLLQSTECGCPLPALYFGNPNHKRVHSVMKVNELSKHGNLPEHCGGDDFQLFSCLGVKNAFKFQA